MSIFHLMKCSWHHLATVISVVALISVVCLFFRPIFPTTLDYFSGRNVQRSYSLGNGSVGVESENLDKNFMLNIDFNKSFPTDSYGAVIYRGAPWKGEIGKWFSGCDPVLSSIDVVENISGKQCQNDCSNQGICNRELGQCRCFHGYSGEDCTKKVHFGCNEPSSQEFPYGPWIVSICPAHCDTTRAMCFCGEGTKYPNRPVPETCGFEIILATESGVEGVNWRKPDHENIYTTNASKPGWCNVDPEKAHASKMQFKQNCDCKYDGLMGRFCEIPTLCSCLNQCSGHGHCRGGFCQCDNDWYGIDCSIPSTSSPLDEFPTWLRPSTVNIPDKASLIKDMKVNATVKKKRPLIYVYDLPPEFDSHLLEGRHFKLECVNRVYDEKNRTLWSHQLYGAQIALYESILASPHRTLNGEEADYFFVPVLDSCIITRAGDAPHLRMEEHGGLRSFQTLDYYKDAYDYIIEHYPYWNRSSGKDHIWFFAWDEGACYAPKEIWNSMMLVHWGNTNTKHRNSTTAYWLDNWDPIPSEKRGDHPCFDPSKDLVLPAWKKPNPGAIWLKLWSRPRKKRTTLFYFDGNLGLAYADGRPEDKYSLGLRQKLAFEFGSTPDKEGKLGKQHRSDIIVTPLRSDKYYEEISRSLFCGVLPGDGWSGRMEDSILQGCIPVIIQDGIFLPYENVLNYKSFAVRIAEDDIPNLIHILEAFSESEVESMLANVRRIWQRFLYKDSILLEAERQKKLFAEEDAWAVEVSKLEKEDDVFSTFIQILHYKLHNDPWRRQRLPQKKEYGLPKVCLKTAD